MGTREIRKEIYADYIRHIEEHNEENRLAAEVMRRLSFSRPMLARSVYGLI